MNLITMSKPELTCSYKITSQLAIEASTTQGATWSLALAATLFFAP